MKCNNLANFRYTWPGQKEAYSCLEHAIQIRNVANAMGLPLQFIQLTAGDMVPDFPTCSSEVRDDGK